MPATEHLFSEPAPPRLYIDTDIVLAYLNANESLHTRCIPFFESIALNRGTELYTSSLLWLEFAHVITREAFRTRLPESVQRRFRLDRWHDAQVRSAYLEANLRDLSELLGQFVLHEVALTPAVRTLAVEQMARFALGSQDATHLASASLAGVDGFASFDEAFRRVDGLQLWNDRSSLS